MVANLTHIPNKKKLPLADLDALACKAQALKADLVVAVDADTAAFDDLMTAMRLPKDSKEQESERAVAIRNATKRATDIPLQVIRAAAETAELTDAARSIGNPATLSDSGVAAAAALTGATGAFYNVLINLAELDAQDAEFIQATRTEAAALLQRAVDASTRTQEAVRAKLETDLA